MRKLTRFFKTALLSTLAIGSVITTSAILFPQTAMAIGKGWFKKVFHVIRIIVDLVDDALQAKVDKAAIGDTIPVQLSLDLANVATYQEELSKNGITIGDGTMTMKSDLLIINSTDGSKKLVVPAGSYRYDSEGNISTEGVIKRN